MAPSLYRSLGLVIDFGSYAIRHHDRKVHLRQQAMQVLVLLVTHRERLLSKDEILADVWRGVAVTDEALSQCIKELRKALGDDAKSPRFIRTVPKAGYQFIAPIEPLEADTPAQGAIPGPRSAVDRRVRLAGWLGGAAALAAAAGSWGMAFRTEPPSPERSGVVLLDSTTPAILTTSAEAERAYNAGLDLSANLRGEAAIEQFSKAVALDPDFAMAHARIGYVHAITNARGPVGKPHLERALALGSRMTDFDRIQVQAWYALANGDYGAAIGLYRSLVKTRPSDADATRRLSALLAGEERFDEAIAVLEQGLSVLPNAPVLLNPLGLLFSDVGRYDDAIAAVTRLVAVAPDEANLQDSAGLVFEAAGRFDEALSAYDRAIVLDPAFVIPRLHRGNLLYRQGRYRHARAAFDEAFDRARTGSERARALMSSAWLSYRTGDTAGARATVARAERLDPAAPPSWIETIVAGPDAARVLPVRFVHLAGRGARASLRLECVRQGFLASAQGRPAEAIGWFRQAVGHRGVQWSLETFDDVLASEYLEQGQLDQAITEFNRVLAAKPWLARPRYQLARALALRGDMTGARDSYQRFLEGWSTADADAPEVLSARAWLASSVSDRRE